MTRSRIRTAIIGAGFIGRVHLEAIRRLGLVDVVAIADISGDSAARLAEAFGVERATDDVTAVLSDGSTVIWLDMSARRSMLVAIASPVFVDSKSLRIAP